MSAVPSGTVTYAPGGIETSPDWLTTPEAARRLGVSARHIRRRCHDQWHTVQLAVQRDGEWYIHTSADPALANPASQPEFLIRDDFKVMPPAQQTTAMQRAECVRRFRLAKATREGAVTQWLPGLLTELNKAYADLKVSRTSLYRWDKRAGNPIDVAELVDWRGWSTSEAGGAGSVEAWRYFTEQFLDGNEPSLADCWRRTRTWSDARGLDWCSIHSCKRQLDQRIPKEMQVKHRRPSEWRSRYATYIEQNPERHAAGDCWVSDHRPLDLICKFEGKTVRPVITLWHDWRTRKVVGWHLSANPNTDTILAAFSMAVKDPSNMGPPLMVWMDNGKDFDSQALNGRSKRERQRSRGKTQFDETWFGGVFGAFGIEAHFSLAHNPQGKARCERWFATMASQFDKQWATYTGKDTVRKPEDLAFKINKRPHVIPDFNVVQNHVADFVAAYNVNIDHAMDDLCDDQSRQKLSPCQAYQAWATPRVLADPAALDLCLMPHTRPVKVGRQGVRVQLPGCPARHYGQYEPALRRYKGTGQKVFVAYDPADTRTVQIRNEKLELVCVARVNNDTGVYGTPQSREALKAAMAERKAYNRGLELQRKHQRAAMLPDDHLIREVANEKHQAQQPKDVTPDPDRPLRLIQTPFDGQSKDLEQQSMRKAAGTEHYEEPRFEVPAESQDSHDDDSDVLDWSKLNGLDQSSDDLDDDTFDLADAAATFAAEDDETMLDTDDECFDDDAGEDEDVTSTGDLLKDLS